MKTKGKWIAIAAGVVAVAYCGIYGFLRSQFVITHISNESHWDVEKRSPGHLVCATSKSRAANKTIDFSFWPLMRMEEVVHDLAGRRGRPTSATAWDRSQESSGPVP